MKKIVVNHGNKEAKQELPKEERSVGSVQASKKEPSSFKEDHSKRKKVYLEKEDLTLEKKGRYFMNPHTKRYQVAFVANMDQERLFTLTKDEHPLTLSFLGKKEKTKGRSHANHMTYKDVYKGVDFTYQCHEEGIKESIVIKEKQASYDFDFTMEIGDLVPTFNEEENALELKKDDKTIYRILSPYMVDQNHERSDDCRYIIKEENKVLTITLHADASWIEDEKRVFPIIIDPTIEVLSTPVFQIEALVNGDVNETSGDYTLGRVRNDTDWTYYSLRITIDSAQIQKDYRGAEYVELQLQTKELANQENLDANRYFVYCNGEKVGDITKREIKNELCIDLTPFIQDTTTLEVILCHPSDNYLAAYNISSNVIIPSENSTTSDSRVTFYGFGEDQSHEPCLIIESDQNVNSEADTISYPIGRAGTTMIQVMNGHFWHIHPDNITIQQGSLSLSLSHIYDRRFGSENVTGFGNGWKSNVHQYLKKSATYHETKGDKEIIYIDGEGKKHFLYERWYYQENDQEIEVNKDDVYLDGDMKLKYRDQDQHEHEVEYECTSDDGLQYIGAASIYNYHSRERIIAKGELFIPISNGELALEINEDQTVKVPHFYAENSEMYAKSYLKHNEVYQTADGFIDANGNTLIKEEIESSIYFDDGEIKVLVYKGSIFLSSAWQYVRGIPTIVKLRQSNIFDYEDDVLEVYVNEDLKSALTKIESIDHQFEEWDKSSALILRQKRLTDQEKKHYQDKWDETYSTTGEEGKQEPTDEEQKTHKRELERYDISLQSYNDQLSSLLSNYQSLIFEKKRLLALRKTLIDNQLQQANDFLVDQNGNTLGFDGYGRLILIQDKYENEIHIEYGYEKTNKGKIISVYSDQEAIRFTYNKKTGVLSAIVDSHGRKTRYQYNKAQDLLTIIYPDNNETTCSYDTGFNMTSPLLESNNLIYGLRQLRIKKYCYGGIIEDNNDIDEHISSLLCLDERYILSNDHLRTIIRNSIKNPSDATSEQAGDIVYNFDISGNTIAISQQGKSTVYHYQDKLLLHELTFQNQESQSVIVGFNSGPFNHIFAKGELPVSNLIGIKIVGNGKYQGNLSYQLGCTLYQSKEDGTMTSITDDYEINSLPMIIPLVVDYRNTTSIEIAISSDLASFVNESGKPIQIIRLESGTIYQYDTNKRLFNEQNGYKFIRYSNFNDDDLPLTKVERSIFNEELVMHYCYDANKQLTYSEDSKGNVEEYYYDEKGNCIEKRVYNKKDASLMKVERASYDEQGRPISSLGAIKGNDGKYPSEEITYLPKTNIESKIKGVNGESRCYQYDFHSGDLLSISSSAGGINNSTSFTYNYGLLTTMTHHGMKVEYRYDGQGRKVETLLNGERLVLNNYIDHYQSANDENYQHNEEIIDGSFVLSVTRSGLVSKIYKNDQDKVIYVDSICGDNCTDSVYYVYEEDKLMKIDYLNREFGSDTTDEYNEIVYYTYDEFGQIVKQEKKIDSVIQVASEDHYDDNHRFVTSSDVILNEDSAHPLHTINSYNESNQIKTIKITQGSLNSDNEMSYAPISTTTFDYDALGRIKHQELHAKKVKLCHTYSYLQQDDNSLDFISEDVTKIQITGENQTTYLTEASKYTYDVNGNIIDIESDENHTRYQYDSLNRLIREDNPYFRKTYVYQYDQAGNILLKKTYPYNIIYTEIQSKGTVIEYVYDCENGDRLISFDGKNIVYDQVGRPTTYKGMSFQWNGRNQLTKIGANITYQYGNNGIRRKKIVNGVETTYITNGSQILSMKNGVSTFMFRYVLNKLVGFNYNNGSSSKEYIYQRNIQGDIIGIFDDEGNQVGGYAYDAYGNHVITIDEGGIATLNPFRYRGYYWDEESKLYYLNSRYYDPETGRFISPDDLSILDETMGQINGLNLYMYCADNPVMNVDPIGHSWETFWNSVGNWFANNWQWVAGAAIIVACAVLTIVTAGGFAAAGGAILSVFTSTMAVNAAAATFAGAFVGSILLAGVGTVIGGLISTSNGGSFLDGAKWGFFGGAVIGAVIGGVWGYSHYALQAAGKMGVKVDINSLINNPADEFVTIGPKDGGISGYIRSISETGNYGQIYAKRIYDGVFQIANGHHRVEALRRLGYRFIKIYLVS